VMEGKYIFNDGIHIRLFITLY